MGQPCQNPSVAGERKKILSFSLLLQKCSLRRYICRLIYFSTQLFSPCLLLPVFVLGVSFKKLKERLIVLY